MRLLALLVALSSVALLAQEPRLVLSKPQPSTTEYTIEQIFLTWPNSNDPNTCQISITLRGNVGGPLPFSHAYSGEPACKLLDVLNRADFSQASLKRRLFVQLLADKVLDGKIVEESKK